MSLAVVKNSNYKAVIFARIKYNKIINPRNERITRIRNFGTLNKFLNGAKIIKIRPIRLLIKKRGYRDILFQKSFI